MSGRSKSKKNNNKSNQENINNKYDPENDTSVLTKPFATSISGLPGVLKAFNNATTEVKDYLSNECDILFECRICRNIFRSVSNFITHKRSYCLDKYNCVIHLKCSNKRENDYQIKEKEPEQNTKENTDSEEIPKRTTRKSLQTLVESLAQKKQFGIERKDFSIDEFYKERNPDLFNNGNNETNKNDIKIDLEHINGSKSGVYQTFKDEEQCNDKQDEMKLEVKEIHDMLEGQSVVLGPDGKILDFNSGNTVRLGVTTGDNPDNRVCSECNMKFATRKTYTSHMKYKHANTRLVYPCPECSDILATSWSVYRHLFNIHHKTLAQVKKLRNHIQAKAFYQVQTANKKTTSSPVKSNEHTVDDANEEWIDNFETDNDIQMCGGCGKRFERRAALNSHSQTCSKRIAAKNTIVVNRLKRTAVDEKSIDKVPKAPKLDVPDVINIDRRKASVIRRRKIGIQIRYDYTKPSDKTLNNSSIREDIRTVKVDLSKEDSEQSQETSDASPPNKSDDTIDANFTANTQEIYSILGIPENKKDDSKDTLMESEVLSINSSSNNTTPNKDEPSTQDSYDSEIEEIFTSSTEVDKKNPKQANNPKEKLDDTIRLIKLLNSNSPVENKVTLDEKMSEYVDTKKFQCLPCNINFSNISKLRLHMSEHFNWMKYTCDICSFKSYEKIAVIDHIDKVHNVDDPIKIEAVILQIPEWETIKMASDKFIPIIKEEEVTEVIDDEKDECSIVKEPSEEKDETPQNKNEEDELPKLIRGRGRPPKKRKTTNQNHENDDAEGVKEEIKEESNDNSNLQALAIRNMVLEVIFGQNSESNIETESVISNSDSDVSKYCPSPETNNIASRPVRNRIKTKNKDFIYDLNDFTDIPRSLSQNSNRLQNNQTEKPLSRSLEDLSQVKNKNKKSGKKSPGSKCNSILNVSDNDISVSNLQSKKVNNEDCSSNKTTDSNFLENKLTSFEIQSKIVNIQNDDEVWIIDDE